MSEFQLKYEEKVRSIASAIGQAKRADGYGILLDTRRGVVRRAAPRPGKGRGTPLPDRRPLRRAARSGASAMRREEFTGCDRATKGEPI